MIRPRSLPAGLLLAVILLLGSPAAHASWLSSSSVVPQWSPHAETEEAIARAEMPWRDLSELAIRVKGIPPVEAAPPRLAAPASRTVGHRTSYWVADVAGDKYYSVPATLQHVTPHLYMYVADDARVDTAKLREAATFFEEKIYQRNRGYFGSEKIAGFRGDPHLTILSASIPGLGVTSPRWTTTHDPSSSTATKRRSCTSTSMPRLPAPTSSIPY